MSFFKTYTNLQAVADALNLSGQISKVKIYSYTGDGAASLAITGVGFKPKAVIAWEQVTNKALVMKTDQDGTKSLVVIGNAANLYVDDQIISLDADGFTVGDGTGSTNYANEAQAYTYIAFG